MGNLGVFADDWATVELSRGLHHRRHYRTGQNCGFFLTVQGYNAAKQRQYRYPYVPSREHSALSAAILNVVLDGTNTGGNFNTVQAATKLEIDKPRGRPAARAGVFQRELERLSPMPATGSRSSMPRIFTMGARRVVGTINANGTSGTWNSP